MRAHNVGICWLLIVQGSNLESEGLARHEMIHPQRIDAEEERKKEAERETEKMTSYQRPTAKIYAFPSGGRAPPGRQREGAKTTAHYPQRPAAAEPTPEIVFGSSWYHQAAVDEAANSWER